MKPHSIKKEFARTALSCTLLLLTAQGRALALELNGVPHYIKASS
jgi:hypothetical protein